MKKLIILLLILGFVPLLSLEVIAQQPSCGSNVPFYQVDLTGTADSVWYSPPHSRQGNCCGTSSPDRCTSFEVNLDVNAVAVIFSIVNGAIPPGSLFYQVDCGPITPVGEHICIYTPGIHYLSFCKPGNNDNTYAVTSISRPMFPGEDTVEVECSKVLEVHGLTEYSTNWISVYPGAPGQYDSLLSCTNCTHPVFSPVVGSPEYIDYVVSGAPIASDCGVGMFFVDTIRVHTLPRLEANISPSPATYCIGVGSGVLITATPSGGDGHYSYVWKNEANVTVSTGPTYFATAEETLTVILSDGQTGVNCPPAIGQVEVMTEPLPIVNAGPDQYLCHETASVQLNGSVLNAPGGIWSGGAGSFSPSNTTLNAIYFPTPAEISSGSVQLTLTSQNVGICQNTSDQVVLHFAPAIQIVPNYSPILCYGGQTTINLSVSGGTPAYSYLWSTGATSASLSDVTANTYTVTVTDNISCSATQTIIVSQPTVLTASAFSSFQVSCYNMNDAVITVSASGGTGAYTYSLLGGPAQSSNVFNGVAAGLYKVTVYDANNCSVTTNAVYIVNPPPVTASAVGSAQVSCFNATDGVITVTATGGTGAYTYSLNGAPVQDSNIFSGLGSGSYSVTVYDVNNCSATTNAVIIINPPLLTASAVGSYQVSCYNATDGVITVTALGGTGAYTYSLNGAPAQGSNVFSGLGSGSYTVTVYDANNCSATTNTVIIINPPLLTASAVGSYQVSCFNATDGVITVTALGGTGAYTYSLNGAPAQGSNVFSGLGSGSYSVTVRDVNNCSATTNTVIIINPPLLTASAVGSYQVSCFNATDGVITVTAQGGTGAYTYSLNGAPAQGSNVFSGLGSGSHIVTVVDANNCSATTNSVLIINPRKLTASAAGSYQVSCFNATDGQITVIAAGGTGAYTYSLNGAPVQGSNVFSGLGSGSYTVTVRDANNCSANTNTVIIINPPLLTASAVGSSQVSCFNATDGVITVSAQGGTGAYTYSLNGAPAQGSNVFSGLSSGSYTVTVRDANNCSTTTNAVIIINPPLLTASVVGSFQVSCFNATDGVITVTAQGGTGAYTYSLNGAPAQGSNVFSGLGSGSYTVTVRDANNCSATTNAVIIINPPLLTATAVGSPQVSCFNATDGVITVSALGGTGAYTYSLNGAPAQGSNVFSGLGSGLYSVTVRDVNNCSATTNAVIILNPPLLTASAVGSYQVSCNNATDGVVTVTAQGGTGAYTYSLNGAPAQSSNVFSGLGSGSYTVTVYDANNCSAITNTMLIFNPKLLTASAVGSYQVSCFNATDGLITVIAAGGTGAYTYSLNGAPAQGSNIFSGLGSGSYTVTVRDANNCSATTNAVIILNPPLLTATAVGSYQVSCFNATDGVITVTAQGGTGTYTYSLNGAPAQGSNVFSGLGSGSYTVTVYDANNCSATTNVVIIINPPLLTASAVGSSQVSCFNATDGVITVTAGGGTGAYTYSLNGAPAQGSNVFSGLGSGSYTITVRDANNCSATTNAVIIINPPLLTASAVGSSQVSCFNATDGVITVTAQGGTGAYTYSLNGAPAQGSNVFSGLGSGSYSVTVYDANNCSATTNAVIILNPPLLTASAVGSYQVSCFNATDGVITVSAQGGTGAYTYSLNGAPAQGANVFSGLGSGSYSVTVRDVNNCTATTNAVIILNPPLLTASAVGSYQVSCFNATDGVITVTAQGGTGAYTYSLNGAPAQGSNVFSGLGSGSYSVTVRDANNCSATTNAVIILNPPLLTASAVGSYQVSCFGAADGQVTVTAQGGTGAYTYSLNGGPIQSSNIFNGLPAGSYIAVVYDINNCSATANAVVIINPAGLSAYAEGSYQVSCHNATDGVITVTALGGTGVYSYSLNGGPVQSSNVFSGLAAGTYTAAVTDDNACPAITNAVIIINPPLLSASAVGSYQVSCFNAMDGQVTVTAQGGTGAYTYSLNGGPVQSSNIFSGLAAGIYTVVVHDANNCSAITNAVVIINPASLAASAEGSVQVSCFNAADGVVTVFASGGTGIYSYSLNGAPAQGSNVFSGLSAGTYTVIVSDMNGCSATTNAVTILNPALLTATAVGSYQVSCFNAQDGQITVTAIGGTGAYTYSLNGAPVQSSNVFSGLPSGGYIITVYDANNCSAYTNEVIIINPPQLLASAVGSFQVSCHNATDGSITVTASGGTGAYAYAITGASAQGSNVFNGLAAGTYFITVYDANQCSATTNAVTIINPEQITAYAEGSSQVSCFNAQDGQVTVFASGGTGVYSYSLNAGVPQSSNVFTGLAAGTYTVAVYDVNNCSALTNAVVIVNADSLQASAGGSYQVGCHDAMDGLIIVYASGGTGAYTYSLNGGTPQSSNSFSNLGADTYTVLVTDGNNCSVTTAALTIYNPDALTIVPENIFPVSCYGAQDGSFSVAVSGGTGDYLYALNGMNPQVSNEFTGLYSGTYYVVVVDGNGCQGVLEDIFIDSPALVTVTAEQSHISCLGEVYNEITVTAQGGVSHYQYSIDGGLTWSNVGIFDSLKPGPFLIIARDTHGCYSGLLPFEVVPLQVMNLEVNIESQNVCGGVADGAVSIVAEGGAPPYNYSLDNKPPTLSSYFDHLAAGTHTIEVFDNSGCKSETVFEIQGKQALKAEIVKLENADCSGTKDGAAEVAVIGGDGPYSYSWNTGATTAYLENVGAGIYTVDIFDINGCKLRFPIQIVPGTAHEDIELHNVFSPNNDGINDTWVVDNIGFYPDNELVILNRWGNEVYTQKNYQNDWDGSRLTEGTYFYLLDINICGEQKVYKGYITIVH